MFQVDFQQKVLIYRQSIKPTYRRRVTIRQFLRYAITQTL